MIYFHPRFIPLCIRVWPLPVNSVCPTDRPEEILVKRNNFRLSKLKFGGTSVIKMFTSRTKRPNPWRAAAVTLLAIGTLANWQQTRADQALDMNECLRLSGGSVTLSRPSVVWGESVEVSWMANLSSYCVGMGVTLQIQADDQLQANTASYTSTQGHVSVTPAATTTVALVAVNGAGSRTLASLPLAVEPWNPEPLPDDSELRPTITLLGNDPVSRRLFVRALRTPNETVIIKGDMDLSGLDGVYVAPGVQIIGDRSVRDAGPRLYTRTFPSELLHVGDEAHGPSDGVRITGIRLDGGMSDDPFTAVGKPEATAIVVRSSQNVEIDHNEIDHWRGKGISIRDPDNRIAQDNADTVRVNDNYIHHNQHPNGNMCLIDGGSHAAGYGVEVSYGAYALIDSNVFDWNRHAIAGDGRDGSGYKAYRNLVLQHGGVHFHCVNVWDIVFGVLTFPLNELGVVDDDHIYHTHQIDMHGRGDNGFGSLAGEWMDIQFNTILYTAGTGIKLRGTPALASESPSSFSVGMDVKHNVFAHQDQWEWINGGVSPGAMSQEETGLQAADNLYGLNTFDARKRCDFDADGQDDDFIATGVAWWYRSTRLGGRWVFLEQSPSRLADVTLEDADGDGRCDVLTSGAVHSAGGDGSRPLIQSPGDVTTIAGTPVNQTLTADGGTAPYSWVVSGLPGGLYATSDGRILGTPSDYSITSSKITAMVTSANHQSDTITFTWTVGSNVPNVTGLSEDAARRTISDSGLRVGNVSREVNFASVGSVIAQSLASGSTVATRTPIDITVSLGAVTVPNVRSWDASSAMNAINAAGLASGEITYVNTCLDPGTVQSTSPSIGAVVAPGTAVKLSVSTCTGTGGGRGGGGNPRQPL